MKAKFKERIVLHGGPDLHLPLDTNGGALGSGKKDYNVFCGFCDSKRKRLGTRKRNSNKKVI